MPDVANATVSWSSGKVKPGSAKVDLTKGDFKAACNVQEITGYKPGTVQTGKREINTGICLAPQFGNVVANP